MELTQEEKKTLTSPMTLMMTLAIDSAMASHSKILDLINDYEKKGIDVVPISELKKVMAEGTDKAMSDDGLLAKMLRQTNDSENEQ